MLAIADTIGHDGNAIFILLPIEDRVRVRVGVRVRVRVRVRVSSAESQILLIKDKSLQTRVYNSGR